MSIRPIMLAGALAVSALGLAGCDQNFFKEQGGAAAQQGDAQAANQATIAKAKSLQTIFPTLSKDKACAQASKQFNGDVAKCINALSQASSLQTMKTIKTAALNTTSLTKLHIVG